MKRKVDFLGTIRELFPINLSFLDKRLNIIRSCKKAESEWKIDESHLYNTKRDVKVAVAKAFLSSPQ